VTPRARRRAIGWIAAGLVVAGGAAWWWISHSRDEQPVGRDLPPPAETRPARALRVACLNVWAIPFVSDALGERMKRLPPALRAFDADVICLQEVWDPLTRSRLRAALEPEWTGASSSRGGLMVLSRLPILEEEFTPFPAFAGLALAERLGGKGVLEVRLRAPQGDVRVVTAHLALAFGEDNPRSAQIRFLVERLEGRRDLPLVLAADLNTPPLDDGAVPDDYRRLLDAGFRSANPPVSRPDGSLDPGPPTRVGWPRREGYRRGWWPDHVLVRDGERIGVRVAGFRIELADRDTALSDHNLLLADLALEPRR
jgi:endonuclease/exonuclease/phosphatase family metal-dependent hydrolase